MGEALGMIETRGLVAMIEASDAMVKAANVTIVGWRKDRLGLRHGKPVCAADVAAVKAATDAWRLPRHAAWVNTHRRPRDSAPASVARGRAAHRPRGHGCCVALGAAGATRAFVLLLPRPARRINHGCGGQFRQTGNTFRFLRLARSDFSAGENR